MRVFGGSSGVRKVWEWVISGGEHADPYKMAGPWVSHSILSFPCMKLCTTVHSYIGIWVVNSAVVLRGVCSPGKRTEDRDRLKLIPIIETRANRSTSIPPL